MIMYVDCDLDSFSPIVIADIKVKPISASVILYLFVDRDVGVIRIAKNSEHLTCKTIGGSPIVNNLGSIEPPFLS